MRKTLPLDVTRHTSNGHVVDVITFKMIIQKDVLHTHTHTHTRAQQLNVGLLNPTHNVKKKDISMTLL